MLAMKCSVAMLIILANQCYGGQIGYSYQQPESYAISPFVAAPQQSYEPQQAVSYQQYQAQPEVEQYTAPAFQENYRKEFYTYSAPEAEYHDHAAAQKVFNALQRNVRVVFIRAPEQRVIEQAALALANYASDDRTAIYVLNRQPDINDWANKLSVLRDHHSHKPEVHFVKYRTPEEASIAQQNIQAQYDVLQGSTHSSNEGVAPVLNFASPQNYLPPTQSVAVAYGGAGVPGIGSVNTALTVPSYGPVPTYSGYSGASNSHTSYSSSSFAGNTEAVGSVDNTSGGVLTEPIIELGRRAGAPHYGHDQQSYTDNAIAMINERLSAGNRLVFPTDSSIPSNTYLPPFKRKRSN